MSKLAALGLAAVLGLSAVSSVSAQGLSFGFFFGDEKRDLHPPLAMCLTDSQIRRAIAARGYADIRLNVPNEKRIQVRASRDGGVYLIDFDFCSDRIRGIQQLR